MTYRCRSLSMERHPGPEGHLSFHLFFVYYMVINCAKVCVAELPTGENQNSKTYGLQVYFRALAP